MISPIGIVVVVIVLGAWVGLIFAKELIKFKREERCARKAEARTDHKRQKDMEIQELFQDYGDALKRRREREEQQRQMEEIADMVAARLERSEKERQLQKVVDRASVHVEPER